MRLKTWCCCPHSDLSLGCQPEPGCGCICNQNVRAMVQHPVCPQQAQLRTCSPSPALPHPGSRCTGPAAAMAAAPEAAAYLHVRLRPWQQPPAEPEDASDIDVSQAITFHRLSNGAQRSEESNMIHLFSSCRLDLMQMFAAPVTLCQVNAPCGRTNTAAYRACTC